MRPCELTWFDRTTQSAWHTIGYAPGSPGPREASEAFAWAFMLGAVLAGVILILALAGRVRQTTRRLG